MSKEWNCEYAYLYSKASILPLENFHKYCHFRSENHFWDPCFILTWIFVPAMWNSIRKNISGLEVMAFSKKAKKVARCWLLRMTIMQWYILVKKVLEKYLVILLERIFREQRAQLLNISISRCAVYFQSSNTRWMHSKICQFIHCFDKI